MRQGSTRQKPATRIPSPEGLAPPPGDYATWDEYMLDFEDQVIGAWDEDAERGLKAMRLAPNLSVYRALLKGQDVPASQLDQHWRRRYGL